jgi:serine protease SohB
MDEARPLGRLASRKWSLCMAFWLDIAAFALKAVLIVAALGGLAALLVRLTRPDEAKRREIKVRSLDERYDAMRDDLNAHILDKNERKALAKARKKEAKAAAKARSEGAPGKRIYVLAFKGDIGASAVKRLATEIDAVLTVARPELDEVVLRIESPGGTVTGYGLAAAQLMRLRERKISVTASVDQVAASGGYLMACAADKIVAAPFAILGSIGVVAQVPNLHRLLKKNDIDFEEMTAGEFKRSVSVLGEITPAGREHFRGKLDTTHEAFKAFVQQRRPGLDIAKVANGDIWLATEALGLGLIDGLSTGEDLIFRARGEARLFEVATEARKTLLRQILDGLGFATRLAWDGLASRLG